jgi:hypothetical protein
MKTPIPNRPIRSALRRIVARAEDLAAFQALVLSPTPFADLMLYPERLKAVLNTVERWKQKAVQAPRQAAWLFRTAGASHKKRNGTRRAPGNPFNGLVNTEFHLEAPEAEAVQLAGDFTNWDKSPLDLIRAEDGVWFIIVPLLPGRYTYRFIVDGQWWDDPHPAQLAVNPFGTTDAVVQVTENFATDVQALTPIAHTP